MQLKVNFEYGNAGLVWNILRELMPCLKRLFPHEYMQVMAITAIRVINHTSIRLIKSVWEELYLSKK
jgi:hypothetical protein